jgi:hypothetical protein
MSDELRWSIALIGLALAAAGAVGVFVPPCHRWAVLLPLLAGTGIGIAGLAIGTPDPNEVHSSRAFEQVFFQSTVAGFVTVVAGLTFVWLRDRPAIPHVPT